MTTSEAGSRSSVAGYRAGSTSTMNRGANCSLMREGKIPLVQGPSLVLVLKGVRARKQEARHARERLSIIQEEA
eukprot:7716237-Pyramimonas_sp.AAC.1